MKVIWRTEADEGRRQVAEYIRQSFGKKAMIDFMQEVRNTTKYLRQFPDIAPKDHLFDDRDEIYRCILINNLSRLVYRVDGDVVNIVGFWDCRRDPVAQAKRVK